MTTKQLETLAEKLNTKRIEFAPEKSDNCTAVLIPIIRALRETASALGESGEVEPPRSLANRIITDRKNPLYAKYHAADPDTVSLVNSLLMGEADQPPAVSREEHARLVAELAAAQRKQEARDGNWIDKWGCCKVCNGEIPNGHSENCDLYKLEMRVHAAEASLAKAQADGAAMREALKQFAETRNWGGITHPDNSLSLVWRGSDSDPDGTARKALSPNPGQPLLDKIEGLEKAVAEKDAALAEARDLVIGYGLAQRPEPAHVLVRGVSEVVRKALSPSAGSTYVSAEKHEELLRLAGNLSDALATVLDACNRLNAPLGFDIFTQAKTARAAYESAKLQFDGRAKA